MFYSDTHRIAFRIIPRTASHSIRSWLTSTLGGVVEAKVLPNGVPPEHIADYFKFGCVRNPYDRLASGFAYSKRKSYLSSMTFREWATGMESQKNTNWWPMVTFLTEGWNWVKFEDLPGCLGKLAPLKHYAIEFPHINASKPLKGRTSLYGDPHMVEYVQRRYAEDFAAYGYSLDPPI